MAIVKSGYTDPTTEAWIDTSYDDGMTGTPSGSGTTPAMGGGFADQTVSAPAMNPGYEAYELGKMKEAAGSGQGTTGFADAISNMGEQAYNALKSKYTDGKGVVDWLKVGSDALKAGAAISAYQAASAPTPKTGYQGGIPSLVAVQQQLAPQAEGVRPGAGGHRYFTDNEYTNAAGLPAAQARIAAQKTSLDAQNLANYQTQVAREPATPTPGQTTDAQVRAAYAANPLAELNPVQSSIDYWKNKGLGSFNNEVNSVRAGNPALAASIDQARNPAQPQMNPQSVAMAHGGLLGLAHGGSTTRPGGTYLQGDTDGMADKIPATIDGDQPARLAHGEFVIPADVVSHLGNGNSDAGAKQLYSMMDRIRQARTGNKKQGKEIDPEKFTPGGTAGYATGGHIPGYAGPTDGSLVGGNGYGGGMGAGVTGTESNLSNWAGPYVTNMLGQGQAAADKKYEPYKGQLSAGASPLQTQAFGNAANLSVPSSIGQAAATAGQVGQKYGQLAYNPTQSTNQFTGTGQYQGNQTTANTFGGDQAQQYMNPYLQQSLNPQLAEARRQSDITQQANNAQMSAAGGYGGGRSAILQAENQRNLGTNLANITGQGYNTAYTNAMGQFNADQARNMGAQAANVNQQQFGATQGLSNASNTAQYGQAAQAANVNQQQFGANYGLQALQGQLGAAQTQGGLGVQQNQAGLANLQTQLAAGGQQRDITQQGVVADKAAFDAERDNPYKMVQFQQSLLQGLPLAAQSYSITNNPVTAAAGALSTVNTALGGK